MSATQWDVVVAKLIRYDNHVPSAMITLARGYRYVVAKRKVARITGLR